MFFAFVFQLVYDIILGILVALKTFSIKCVKMLTHDWCDNCGFTKDKVLTIELYTESGYRSCKKCISKE